ncbi:MAG: MarR family transcriptional regulator, partial [Actinobacteria bacterium]|nr:MarR family transcriptional regulator [Actinomycetota bacterium]
LTTGLLDSALSDSGLNADDFGLYSMLRGWGPLTPGQLAAITGMRQNTVSAALQRLDKRGHLTRQAVPEDARSTRVRLNKAGVAAHQGGTEGFLKVAESISQLLGSQEAPTRQALQQLDEILRHRLDAADRPYSTPALDPDSTWNLELTGPALNGSQRRELEQYARWLLQRDNPEP